MSQEDGQQSRDSLVLPEPGSGDVGTDGGTANRSRGSLEEQSPAAPGVAEELGSGLRGAWELQAGLKTDVWFLELPLLGLGGR